MKEFREEIDRDNLKSDNNRLKIVNNGIKINVIDRIDELYEEFLREDGGYYNTGELLCVENFIEYYLRDRL